MEYYKVNQRVRDLLMKLFEEPFGRLEWLKTPNEDFDNVAPMKLLDMKKEQIVIDYLEDVLLGRPH